MVPSSFLWIPRRGINFVTKKIVRRLCEIKKNKKGTLYLVNLDARRDWGYAKEYSEIYANNGQQDGDSKAQY